jgi:hypothetical protein
METEVTVKVIYSTTLPLRIEIPGVVGHTKGDDDYAGYVDLEDLKSTS